MSDEKTSLLDYWLQLKKHDWYYEFSEDQSSWNRGRAEEGRLYGLRTTSPEHEKMWEDWNNHINDGIKQVPNPRPQPPRP